MPSGRKISKATLFHALNLGGWVALATGFFAWALTTEGLLAALVNNAVFAGCGWSALYFWINSSLALEIERTRVTNALKLADSARLRALQSQLKPHFLFNTLNGIATLVRERNNVAAGAMIAALSDFLRLTLQTLDSPEITVSQELLFVDRAQVEPQLPQRHRPSSRHGTVSAPPPFLRGRC